MKRWFFLLCLILTLSGKTLAFEDNLGAFIEENNFLDENLDIILDDVLDRGEKSIYDIFEQNDIFEVKNMDELLTINNIIDEDDIRSLERQNNDDFDLNAFISNLSIIPPKEYKKPKPAAGEEEAVFNVVLDAGHGGKDPGAIGRMGLFEKSVNLAFTKEISKELKKYKNIKVFLTRDGDTFMELQDRVKKSMDWDADLFISIHADSNKNAWVSGLSIYILNEEGFNDRAVGILKARYSGQDFLRNKNRLIRRARNANLVSSNDFSKRLVKNLRRNEVNMIKNPIKKANFAVLISPNYPSLLLELGFLSNRGDEKMLASLAYRKKIAVAVAEVIGEYSLLKK